MRSTWLACLLVVAACDCGDDDPMTMPDADTDAGSDANVTVTCTEGVIPRAYVIEAGADDSPMPDGIGGVGDLVLENDSIRAVISAIDRPVHLGASGGTLTDLYLIGQDDHFNEVSQLGGASQGLRVRYEGEPEIVEDAAGFVAAIVVTGRVEPEPTFESDALTQDQARALAVTTRYELRCNERIVHVSSTVENTGTETAALGTPGLMPMDLLLWGSRSLAPFCPVEGAIDGCPRYDPDDLLGSVVFAKYYAGMGSLTGTPGSFAYFVEGVAGEDMLSVHETDFSSIGPGLGGMIRAGASSTFERAIAVGDRADAASATDLALEALATAGHMEIGRVEGRVAPPEGGFGDDPRARPLVYLATHTGTDARNRWVPTTVVRVEPDGAFAASVPAGPVVWEVRHSSAAPVTGTPGEVAAGETLTLADVSLDPLAAIDIEVLDDETGAGLPARVVVVGEGETPSPILGPVGGASPAGDIALTDGDGLVTVRAPLGTYRVYATHGIGWSIARSEPITLDDATGASVTLRIRSLSVIPAGFLTADLHVHSAASFDSSLPPVDRVLSYVAEGVDAIVSTEHDVLYDYGPSLAALEESLPPAWDGRLRTFVGIEATSFVPWEEFPHTIGHHNSFPLTVQEGAWKNGAPVDEYLTPAALYEALRAIPSPLAGGRQAIAQLNHPRDQRYGSAWSGYFDSCGLDPLAAVDGTHACFASIGDLDAIEITNGQGPAKWLESQRDWLAVLRSSPNGILPVATANSDSHQLSNAGYPVNLIRTDTPLAELGDDAFVDALRTGTSAGAVGVVVWAEACDLGASACDGDTGFSPPSRTPLAATGASVRVRVQVRAAPWVPVDELRIRVGGVVAQTIALTSPTDPYDQTDASVVRYDDVVDLDVGDADTFITVEAGFELTRDAMGEIVVGEAPQPFATIARGRHPYGFTNAIYVDRTADGDYDPIGTPLTE